MPVVKTEQVNVRLPEQPPSYNSRNRPISLSEDNGRHAHRYAYDGSIRVRGPYPYQGSSHPHDRGVNQEVHRRRENLEGVESQRRELALTTDKYASALTEVIRNASHEELLNAGNLAYRRALQNLAQAQTEAAQYHLKNMEVCAALMSTRNAHVQLVEQYRSSLRQIDQGIQPADPTQRQTTIQATSFTPEQGTNTGETSTHLAQEDNGPIAQPGGFALRTQTRPRYTIMEPRPSDLPFEVFWEKSDWLGKSLPYGTFVRDRRGSYLVHLMRGIRDTARRIWTELDNSGSEIAKSFCKNSPEFKATYVATIEEIYPCLKLCKGHWKAMLVGVTAYPHWYARRNRKREQISDPVKPDVL